MRRILKKNKNGMFFLYKSEHKSHKIDLDKKTKLWISSNFLFKELYYENKEKAKNELKELIRHNENIQNFENCLNLKKLFDIEEL